MSWDTLQINWIWNSSPWWIQIVQVILALCLLFFFLGRALERSDKPLSSIFCVVLALGFAVMAVSPWAIGALIMAAIALIVFFAT